MGSSLNSSSFAEKMPKRALLRLRSGVSPIAVLRRILMIGGSIFNFKFVTLKYIVEPHSWSIAADGKNISRELQELDHDFEVKVTERPYLFKSHIVHFGSQFMLQNWLPHMKSQNIIVSFYHGKYGDGSEIDSNINFIIENQHKLKNIIVSFDIMKKRLIDLGLSAELITKIPIGVDTKVFRPLSSDAELHRLKRQYNIPAFCKIIGSFQKDGKGWKLGLEPKLIKGPDLLVESLKLISEKIPIFVVLTGPSRGYVKENLTQLNIPFIHLQIEDSNELVNLYRLLDLYLITSREEGGPKGLLEALSTGCPVVSTPVGMANDLISHSKFYRVTNTFHSKTIATEALSILRNTNCPDKSSLRSHVLEYDWKTIAKLLLENVYLPILLNTNKETE